MSTATKIVQALRTSFADDLSQWEELFQLEADSNADQFLQLIARLIERDPKEKDRLRQMAISLSAENVPPAAESLDSVQVLEAESVSFIWSGLGQSELAKNAMREDLDRRLGNEFKSDAYESPQGGPSERDHDAFTVVGPNQPDHGRSKQDPASLALSLNDELERIEQIIESHSAEYFNGAPITPMNALGTCECVVIGRVLAEDADGNMNPNALVIEGSYRSSRNSIAVLHLDQLQPECEYLLYPGKIVACYGIGESLASGQNSFHAYNIIGGLTPIVKPPTKLEVLKPSTTLDICVMGGPYIGDNRECYDFGSLEKGLSEIARLSPSLAIIQGPFMTYKSKMLTHASGARGGSVLKTLSRRSDEKAVTFGNIYVKSFRLIEQYLAMKGVKVIVVPHVEDVLDVGAMPQRPFDEAIPAVKAIKWHTNMSFASNPLRLNLNGVPTVILGADNAGRHVPAKKNKSVIVRSKMKQSIWRNDGTEQNHLMPGICGANEGDRNWISSSAIQALKIDSEFDPCLVINSLVKPKGLFLNTHSRLICSSNESLVHLRVLPPQEGGETKDRVQAKVLY